MTPARLDASPNLNDPGTWSPQRQRLIWLLAFVAVMGLAWAFWLEGEQARWTHEREREAVLRDEHAAMMQRIKGLQALVARKAQLEEELGRLDRQLPRAAEMDGLMRGITASGRVRGLQFELFRPAPTQLKEDYAEIPVALRVVGAYNDIGAFMGDLARLPRIVTVHNLVVTPQGYLVGAGDRPAMASSRLLVLEATLRTYRALDAQEALQVKRRQEKPGAAGPAATPPSPAAAGVAR